MRHNSDTSIALSTENKRSSNLQNKLSKHNPKLKENQKCLAHFKKDNLSQIEENYEPSLGMSMENKREDMSLKHELHLFQRFQSSSRNGISPVAENAPCIIKPATISIKGGLNLIRLVSKFIRQLKTQSQLQKYKIINNSTLSLIGDLSSQDDLFLIMRDQFFHQSFTKNLSSIIFYLQNIIEKIPTLQPDNLILLIFKFALFIMLILNITYIPFELFWEEEENIKANYSRAFDTFPTVFCIVDGGLRLITSYYSEGVLYQEKRKIVKQYLKQDFLIDLLAIIPLFFEERTLHYLKFLRIVKLKLTLGVLEEILCLKQSMQCYWELLKSIFFIVYFCHFLACIWHKIGQIGFQEGRNNWLVAHELNNTSIMNQYCFSLYFIVITTLTIGYGDILPTNVYETFFTIFIAFTGCSVLGYTINNIGDIFKGLNENELKFIQQMKHIQQYLKQYKINQNLSLQIRKYFEYHIKAAIKKNNDGEILMNQLSKQLKEKMQIDLYKKYLIKAKIVKDCCSQSTIDKLCQQITIENYVPESQIFKQQSFCEKLYYVLEGQLEIYIYLGNEREVHIVESVGKDQFIGQWEFLLQSPYQFSLKAKKLTKLLAINRTDFTKVMKENQEDFENYCQIRDQILFQSKTKGSKCYICGWIHYFDKCPFVFLSPDQTKILQKAMQNHSQSREVIHSKRKIVKSPTFKSIQNKRQAALDFIQELDNNDLTLNYLLDLGFNKSDSILHASSNYIEELISNKLLGTHKIIENEDDSSNSFSKPQVVGLYKNRSIIFNPCDNNDSFLNLRFQTNDQLNGPGSQQNNKRRNTRESSKIKQSQARLLVSTKKIDSKILLQKKNDASSNFISQISSNLNNILATNNNILVNPQNDFGSQYGSSQQKSEPPSSLQANNSFQVQNQPYITYTNFDIDKSFIFKNYFKQQNLYEIVKDLIQLQQQQFKLSQIYKSPTQVHRDKSFKLPSGRSFRKKILLSQNLHKDSVKT